MFSSNVLSHIFSYLPLEDLQNITKVCKRYKNSAKSPGLYKREFVRLFMSEFETSHTFCSKWLECCNKENLIKNSLDRLISAMVQCPQLNSLYDRLTETLAFPEIELPELRRDYLTFPTLVQDMLANPGPSRTSSLLAWGEDVDEKLKLFKNVFENLPKNAVYSYLIPLYQLTQSKIRNYCRAAGQLIAESDDPLMNYLKLWQNYSFSIKNLNDLLLPFIEHCNDAYLDATSEQEGIIMFDFMKDMIEVWKKFTFEPVKELVFKGFFMNIESIQSKGAENNKWYECKNFVESMLDLSLNMVDIHFKNHSKLVPDSCYQELSEKVIDYVKRTALAGFEDLDEIEAFSRLFPSLTYKLIVKAVGGLRTIQDLDLEYIENMLNDQDYLIEMRARHQGLTKSDIALYNSCRSIQLVDILTHLQSFHSSKCT